jgi:hypothetical protein
MTDDELATFMVGIDHRPWPEQITLIYSLLEQGGYWSHLHSPAMDAYIKRNAGALCAYFWGDTYR